jgi:hypothetical protein
MLGRDNIAQRTGNAQSRLHIWEPILDDIFRNLIFRRIRIRTYVLESQRVASFFIDLENRRIYLHANK